MLSLAAPVTLAAGPAAPAVIPATPAAAPVTPAPAPDSSEVGLHGIARYAGSTVTTTVVGFNLKGDIFWRRLDIPDLDILLQPDGKRLVPILRLLKAFQVAVNDSATSLVFAAEGGARTRIDYASKEIAIGLAPPRSIPIVIGYSDMTNQLDLYLDDSVLSEILGFEVAWSEAEYGYKAQTSRRLKVFGSLSQARRSAEPSAARTTTIDLPGNLPPADIARVAPPSVDFAELGLESNVSQGGGIQGTQGVVAPPTLKVWSRVFGGDLRTSLAPRTGLGGWQGIELQNGSWSSVFDSHQVTLGDNGLGLSNLVFPSVTLFGARVNGFLRGPSGADTDPTSMGRQSIFSPSQTFEGTARAGSKVTLLINGREVASQVVESDPQAGPDRGTYRFEGMNLFSNQTNNVRIVAVAPDSSREEEQREILASDLLAPAGTFTYIAGAGKRRVTSVDGSSFQGRFAGARALFGLTSSLTLAAIAAEQSQMFGSHTKSIGTFRTASDSLPGESVHLGSRLLWRPLDPLLVAVEGAYSADSAGTGRGHALTADMEWRLGKLRLMPQVFSYSPQFFGGTNPSIRDRAGARLGLTWVYTRSGRISLGVARARNNVEAQLPMTNMLDLARLDWSTATPIPRTQARIGSAFYRGNIVNGVERATSIGLTSNLIPRWRIEAVRQVGDVGRSPRNFLYGQDLLNGMATGDLSISGSLTSYYRVDRLFAERVEVAVEDRSADLLRRTFLDVDWRRSLGASLEFRVRTGYDWLEKGPFVEPRADLPLDRFRRSAISIEGAVSPRTWSVHLGLQVKYLVGFTGPRPHRMSGIRIDPDAGGVKGRVFVDMNANGRLDPGEPGLAAADVVSDLGDHTKTRADGVFILPGNVRRTRVRVSLDAQTLPATFTPTQGTQEARLRPGLFTEVDLGVGVFGSVSGFVRDAAESDSTRWGVSGIRVTLVDNEGNVVGSSVTANDGSFYIGEVKPGRFSLRCDPSTLPAGFTLEGEAKEIEMTSGLQPVAIDGVKIMGRRTIPAENDTQKSGGIRYKKFR